MIKSIKISFTDALSNLFILLLCLLLPLNSGCHTVNTMVLGCQGRGYLVSLQLLGSEDCTVGGLWLEGNYLLGCLAGLLSGLLACWGAWKLAIWLPHSKYHGSGLPRDHL